MQSELTTERANTAKHRFYLHDIPRLKEKWKYLVCDRDNKVGERAIAKFTCEGAALLFLEVVRREYIANGHYPKETLHEHEVDTED